jgi:hypothetical protein
MLEWILAQMLFCSYGRVEELVYFASLKEQYEIVIHHYVQVLSQPLFICWTLLLLAMLCSLVSLENAKLSSIFFYIEWW